MTLRRALLTLASLAALTSLGGCDQPAAPDDVGVCWHMVPGKDGKPTFNRLAEKVPNLETCAMKLEVMRLNFLRIGGTHTEIAGAYQGQFIWLQREGVYVSQRYDGNRYPALKRLPDGTLAIPSAIPVR